MEWKDGKSFDFDAPLGMTLSKKSRRQSMSGTVRSPINTRRRTAYLSSKPVIEEESDYESCQRTLPTSSFYGTPKSNKKQEQKNLQSQKQHKEMDKKMESYSKVSNLPSRTTRRSSILLKSNIPKQTEIQTKVTTVDKHPLPKKAVPRQTLIKPQQVMSTKFATQLIKEPASKPTKVPATKPAKVPAIKLAKEPTTKSVKEPTTKPAKEPITKSVKEPTTKPAKEPITKSVKEPTTKPAKDPATKPATEPVTTPTKVKIVKKNDQVVDLKITGPGRLRSSVAKANALLNENQSAVTTLTSNTPLETSQCNSMKSNMHTTTDANNQSIVKSTQKRKSVHEPSRTSLKRRSRDLIVSLNKILKDDSVAIGPASPLLTPSELKNLSSHPSKSVNTVYKGGNSKRRSSLIVSLVNDGEDEQMDDDKLISQSNKRKISITNKPITLLSNKLVTDKTPTIDQENTHSLDKLVSHTKIKLRKATPPRTELLASRIVRMRTPLLTPGLTPTRTKRIPVTPYPHAEQEFVTPDCIPGKPLNITMIETPIHEHSIDKSIFQTPTFDLSSGDMTMDESLEKPTKPASQSWCIVM